MERYTDLDEARHALAPINRDNYYTFGPDKDSPVKGIYSKSVLHRMFKDPADALGGLPIKETPKMAFGKMVDAALLEPDVFRSTYKTAVKGPWNANPARADVAKIRASGKTPMKPEHSKQIETIRSSLEKSETARAMLAGEPQVVLKGVAECSYLLDKERVAAFIPIKGLADSIDYSDGEAKIYDLKTTSAFDVPEMWKISKNFGYSWQDVLYTALTHASGTPVRSFHAVFAQTEPPNRVQAVRYSTHARNIAKSGIQQALRTVCALGEGFEVSDLYADVEEFGVDPKWEEVPHVEDFVNDRIQDFKVKFHGAS